MLTRPHLGVGRFAWIAVVAMTAAALTGCDGKAASSAAPVSDLLAVVTGDNVNAIVGIDVAGHRVTRLAAIERNEPQMNVDGLVAYPPRSFVLSDPAGSRSIIWTQVEMGGHAITIRELDRATGVLHDVDVPDPGVLPFLYEGELAWASAPGAGRSRLVNLAGTFEISLPGEPAMVVAGPGTGRITAVVGPPNGIQHVLVVDVAANTATELPTEFGLEFGGLWADESTLVASVPTRLVPTVDDPQNGEPDSRLISWAIAAGSSTTAIAGLDPGPTYPTDPYPRFVAGGGGLIVAARGEFEHPWIEAQRLGSGEAVWRVTLDQPDWITSMTVSGSTVVVLQIRHVTFIDLASGNATTVELGGVTQTIWVGR